MHHITPTPPFWVFSLKASSGLGSLHLVWDQSCSLCILVTAPEQHWDTKMSHDISRAVILFVFQRAAAAWKQAEEATPERSGFVKPRRKGGKTRTAMRTPDLHSKVQSQLQNCFIFAGHNVSICTLSLFSEAFYCNRRVMAGWLEIPPLGC